MENERKILVCKKQIGGGGIENKAFTLIELLAVIVLLALIALIATPIILNIIEKARKSAFLDSAYGIIESVKLYYVEKEINNNIIGDKVFSYDNGNTELNYSGTKPKGGTIILKSDGKIEMAIHNGNWCAIKKTEEENIKLVEYKEGTCKIEALMITEGDSVDNLELGLDSAIPGNYFHIKAQEGTTSCFNLSDEEKIITNTNELKEGDNIIECRIISNNSVIDSLKRTFIVKCPTYIIGGKKITTCDFITDSDGNPRYTGSNPDNYVSFNGKLFRIIGVFNGQMKIIQNDFYSTAIAWDTTGESNGNNNWARPADLNTELNSTYWNTISNTYQAMIDQNHSWGIGTLSSLYNRSNFYSAENNTKWNGRVGLMTPADFGYASSNGNCTDTTELHLASYPCKNDNWLFNDSIAQWTMIRHSSVSDSAWFINIDGHAFAMGVYFVTPGVRPVVYLNSNVKIIDGSGTSIDPYIIK